MSPTTETGSGPERRQSTRPRPGHLRSIAVHEHFPVAAGSSAIAGNPVETVSGHDPGPTPVSKAAGFWRRKGPSQCLLPPACAWQIRASLTSFAHRVTEYRRRGSAGSISSLSYHRPPALLRGQALSVQCGYRIGFVSRRDQSAISFRNATAAWAPQ